MRPLPLLVLCIAACGHPVEPPITMMPVQPPPQQPPPSPPIADGTLDAWVHERALPIARANHCAAAFDGKFLLVAGGNYRPSSSSEFVTLDDVQVARVDADGKLQPWKLAGHLPGPAVECVLAVSGRTLVLLGGLFDDSAMNQKVWTTTLAEDGTLGTWNEVGTLPYGRRALSGGALLKGDTLFLTDSRLPSEGQAEAIFASAKLGNLLGAWTTTQYAAGFRGKPQGAFTGEAAFIIGGYGDGNAVLTDVTSLPLAGGAPAATTPLPEGRTFGAAASAAGWVFVTGGRTQILGVAPQPTVYSAKANGAALGEWTPQRPLPEARSNHTATVVGDFLFVAGGGNSGPGVDSVFRTRVKRLPSTQ